MKSASVISVAMAAVITPPPLLVSPNYGKFHPESELERAGEQRPLPSSSSTSDDDNDEERDSGRGGRRGENSGCCDDALSLSLRLSLILI